MLLFIKVSRFSTLHPMWAVEADSAQQDLALSEVKVSAIDFTRWLNLHLSMNDVLYPASISPLALPGSNNNSNSSNKDSSVAGGIDLESFTKDSRNHLPQRQLTSVHSLTRYVPTVINGSSSTIVHAVTLGSSRQTSFRRSGSRMTMATNSTTNTNSMADHSPSRPNHYSTSSAATSDSDDNNTVYSEHSSSSSRHLLSLRESSEDHMDDFLVSATATASGSATAITLRAEVALPQLFVSYCSKASLYLVSPYYSACITGCVDSNIVVGAVYGAVIVNGCERIRLTVACRKLIVINCVDCEINLATLSTTLVLGDSRNLTLGEGQGFFVPCFCGLCVFGSNSSCECGTLELFQYSYFVLCRLLSVCFDQVRTTHRSVACEDYSARQICRSCCPTTKSHSPLVEWSLTTMTRRINQIPTPWPTICGLHFPM
jgi:hypothetical protein